MSDRDAEIILSGTEQRTKACRWVHAAPDGTRLCFRKPRRSLPQNARMWAMLTQIADQLEYHGRKLTPDNWKRLFLAALHTEVEIVPNLDNTGFTQLSGSSSLTKSQMADLIALIEEYAARQGISAWHWEIDGE